MKFPYVVAFEQFYPEEPNHRWLVFLSGVHDEFRGPTDARRFSNRKDATRHAKRVGAKVYRSNGNPWHTSLEESFSHVAL